MQRIRNKCVCKHNCEVLIYDNLWIKIFNGVVGDPYAEGLFHSVSTLKKVIRELQVMLDKDLATLYGVETRTLNQAVKRNIQRFPSDFRFQLTMEECSKSQIVTLNAGRGQNIKKYLSSG